MIGPTPGEQYLAFIDLDTDYYPAAQELREDLDDAIMEAAELVIAERKLRDPLLRALLADGAALNIWAPYPAGQLPAGAEIRVSNTYGTWEGRTTGETYTRYSAEEVRVTWQVRAVNRLGAEPTVLPDTEVDAWVPLPCDLSAVLAAVDGQPETEPTRGEARPTWDDIRPGQLIEFRHRNRSQRLSGRAPAVRRGRVKDVWRPGDLGRLPQIRLTVLKKDGSPRAGSSGDHVLYHENAIEDVVRVVAEAA